MHICSYDNLSTNERLRKQENKYEQMVYKPGERHLELHSCWNSFTVKVIKRFLRGLQGISGSPLDSFSEKIKVIPLWVLFIFQYIPMKELKDCDKQSCHIPSLFTIRARCDIYIHEITCILV